MALPLHVDPKDPTPIYAQLERAIRIAIATARLQPGQQLPTVRQFQFERRDGTSRLWVRSLDSLESKSLDGTEGATYPFWSQDSEMPLNPSVLTWNW